MKKALIYSVLLSTGLFTAPSWSFATTEDKPAPSVTIAIVGPYTKTDGEGAYPGDGPQNLAEEFEKNNQPNLRQRLLEQSRLKQFANPWTCLAQLYAANGLVTPVDMWTDWGYERARLRNLINNAQRPEYKDLPEEQIAQQLDPPFRRSYDTNIKKNNAAKSLDAGEPSKRIAYFTYEDDLKSFEVRFDGKNREKEYPRENRGLWPPSNAEITEPYLANYVNGVLAKEYSYGIPRPWELWAEAVQHLNSRLNSKDELLNINWDTPMVLRLPFVANIKCTRNQAVDGAITYVFAEAFMHDELRKQTEKRIALYKEKKPVALDEKTIQGFRNVKAAWDLMEKAPDTLPKDFNAKRAPVIFFCDRDLSLYKGYLEWNAKKNPYKPLSLQQTTAKIAADAQAAKAKTSGKNAGDSESEAWNLAAAEYAQRNNIRYIFDKPYAVDVEKLKYKQVRLVDCTDAIRRLALKNLVDNDGFNFKAVGPEARYFAQSAKTQGEPLSRILNDADHFSWESTKQKGGVIQSYDWMGRGGQAYYKRFWDNLAKNPIIRPCASPYNEGPNIVSMELYRLCDVVAKMRKEKASDSEIQKAVKSLFKLDDEATAANLMLALEDPVFSQSSNKQAAQVKQHLEDKKQKTARR